MGFSSYDDMINEMTVNGKQDTFNFYKAYPATVTAGVWSSLWKTAGVPGAGVDVAGAVASGTANSQNGGMLFSNVSTDTRHLVTFGGVCTQNCTLMIYDRLVVVTAVSLTTTGSKAISTAALPRYTGTDAASVQAWLEMTTAGTTTAMQVHLLSYTSSQGNAGLSAGSYTAPVAATPLASLLGPLPPASSSANTGITAVSTMNVDTATTAGIANFVLMQPLAYIPLIANQWNERDLVLQLGALPQIIDGGTLGLAVLPTATGANSIWGMIRAAYG
jgi:hypothetical protein